MRQRVTQDTAPLVSQPGLTSNGTRQIVLRRVHAVVEVPVKEESVDRDGLGLDTPISTSAPNTASTSTSAQKPASAPKTLKAPPLTTELSKAIPRVKRKASGKRTYVEIDDEESERDSASHDSKHSDAEEYQPVSDDGDDELLMGIEVGKISRVEFMFMLIHSQTNRKEVYGMKHVPKPIKTARPPIVAKKRKVPPATKKNRPSVSSRP